MTFILDETVLQSQPFLIYPFLIYLISYEHLLWKPDSPYFPDCPSMTCEFLPTLHFLSSLIPFSFESVPVPPPDCFSVHTFSFYTSEQQSTNISYYFSTQHPILLLYLVFTSSSDILAGISLFFIEINVYIIKLIGGTVDYKVKRKRNLKTFHNPFISALWRFIDCGRGWRYFLDSVRNKGSHSS